MTPTVPLSESHTDTLVRRDIHPPTHPPEGDTSKGYSFGVRVGNQVWVSGQVPFDADGHLVGDGDIEAQCVQALENVRSVVEAAGGRLDDVVKLTTYVTDRSFRETVLAVRRRLFPGPRHPASATVVVDMVVPGVFVEIEAVAVLGATDAG